MGPVAPYRRPERSSSASAYATDGGVHLAGPFLDDITVTVDGTAASTTTSRPAPTAGPPGGFKRLDGTESRDVRALLPRREPHLRRLRRHAAGPARTSSAGPTPGRTGSSASRSRTACWSGTSTRLRRQQHHRPPGPRPGAPGRRPARAVHLPDGGAPSNRRQPFDATFGLQTTDSGHLPPQRRRRRPSRRSNGDPHRSTDLGHEPQYWSADNPLGLGPGRRHRHVMHGRQDQQTRHRTCSSRSASPSDLTERPRRRAPGAIPGPAVVCPAPASPLRHPVPVELPAGNTGAAGSTHGPSTGVRPPHHRRARHPLRAALVHRRARHPEVGRHRTRRARGGLRRGHRLRRLGHRGVRPGLRGGHARPARPRHLPGPAVARREPRHGPDVLRPHPARRHPERGRPPPRAAAGTDQGLRPGVHLLHPPRDRVLPAQAGLDARAAPRADRPVRLLRPRAARQQPRLPAGRHLHARDDGHLGGVQPPRGRPRARTRSTCATPTRSRPPTTS